MKKCTVILAALLLVFSIGQATFAKGSLSLNAGYGFFPKDTYYAEAVAGINLNLSANYYLTNEFSLAGEVSALLIKDVLPSFMHIELFAKYDLLKSNTFTIGAQVGMRETLNLSSGIDQYIVLFGLGVYGNYKVIPALNIFADFKVFPLNNSATVTYFLFTYSANLGVAYAISDSIDLGIEAKISNSKISLWGPVDDVPFDFNVGIKASYNF